MSTKVYVVLAVNKGYEKIDLTLGHSKDEAFKFLKNIGDTRHAYQSEKSDSSSGSECLFIFANKTGVCAFSDNLAIDMALCDKKARIAAVEYGKVLSIAFNDQCWFNVFSLYENSQLVRHVSEMDGDEPGDSVSKGAFLEEEIEAIKNAETIKEDEHGKEYVIDGVSYQVDLSLTGLEVAPRFIDEEICFLYLDQGSIFKRKPWWKRW